MDCFTIARRRMNETPDPAVQRANLTSPRAAGLDPPGEMRYQCVH